MCEASNVDELFENFVAYKMYLLKEIEVLIMWKPIERAALSQSVDNGEKKKIQNMEKIDEKKRHTT